MEGGSPFEEQFWIAVINDDVSSVRRILLDDDQNLAERNFDPESLNSGGFPVVQASKNGNLEMLKLLMVAGADPNADTHRDAEVRAKSNERREFGMPLMVALDSGRLDIIHFLLDRGASVDAHPYCDRDFATRVYADATRVGAPAEMALQSFGFLDDQQREASRQIAFDHPDEIVRLYRRILELGARPQVMEMIRAQHYGLVEMLLKKDPAGASAPGDWIGQTNHEAIVYGAARYGYPEAMQHCFKLCPERHTVYAAAYCIHLAIRSHNRDGDFQDYRRIVELNLQYLTEADDNKSIIAGYEWFDPLVSLSTSFFRSDNFGYRCTVPNTMDNLLELAKLFLKYGFEVNLVHGEQGKSPLSVAIEHGHQRYTDWLLSHGAK